MGPATSLAGRPLGNDFIGKNGWRMYHGQTIPGFPAHPHRGFETVTLANHGFCDHSDSLGAAGRFGEGDVQWMTAGRGVQHSEMFPLLQTDRDNPLELFQIWLNLPQKSKLVDPYFKMLWKEDIPVVEENGVRIKIIAGDYGNTKAPTPTPDSWASDPENGVAIWLLKIGTEANYTLPPAIKGVHRTLYFYKGTNVYIDDEAIAVLSGIETDPTQALEFKGGSEPAHLLLLQGMPIAEPVAQYGPFVMNTDQEIQQAMDEFRLTQYGGWPWRYPDHVHDRDKGRFALYPDGTLVEK